MNSIATTATKIQVTREIEMTANGRGNIWASVFVETAGDQEARVNSLLRGLQGLMAAAVALGVAAVVAELNGTSLAGLVLRLFS